MMLFGVGCMCFVWCREYVFFMVVREKNVFLRRSKASSRRLIDFLAKNEGTEVLFIRSEAIN